jgi:mycothiol S-conjugate amidase
VITHDENGGYFHPDHIQCWRVTTRAFFAAGDPDQYPEIGPAVSQPERLYYSSLPGHFIRLYAWRMRLSGRDPTRMGRNQDIDFTKIGTPRDKLHATIDYRSVWDVKRMASTMHASQGGGTSNSRMFPEWFQRRFLAREYFMRAYPAVPDGFRESDLFAGVMSDGDE